MIRVVDGGDDFYSTLEVAEELDYKMLLEIRKMDERKMNERKMNERKMNERKMNERKMNERKMNGRKMNKRKMNERNMILLVYMKQDTPRFPTFAISFVYLSLHLVVCCPQGTAFGGF